MTELINDNLLKALQKEPVPYTPIWLMRQVPSGVPGNAREGGELPESGPFSRIRHGSDAAAGGSL